MRGEGYVGPFQAAVSEVVPVEAPDLLREVDVAVRLGEFTIAFCA